MTYAAITGWGKSLPPAILSNDDLATFVDTDDAWISSRTGMKERRIAHCEASDMAWVAAEQALACADVEAKDLDMIIFGSCTGDSIVPNNASRVQLLLGADKAAAMDVNTACTSGMYAFSVATAMIKTGSIRNALVIGAEKTSAVLDWRNRNVSILFGDGAAAFVLQASEQEEGVLGETLGCFADARESLYIQNYGTQFTNVADHFATSWDFDGQEIFKKAVGGMVEASSNVIAKCGLDNDQIDLVVPHQANARIIDAVGKRLGISTDKVFVNVERYGNMSAATALVALVEALEEGRVEPGANILMPAFGAGLTWNSHVLRWGQRVTPLGNSDAALPPCDKTALELIQPYLRQQLLQDEVNAAKASDQA
jgi:3-oxoacyl-[acyl-carrier-protein] synthase-3